MSGDLISRNKLIEEINSYQYDTVSTEMRRAEHIVKAHICGLIEKQPTAYDVEKVIDKLKENEQEITSQLEEIAKNAPDEVQKTNLRVTAQLFRDYTKSQIEIVKSGGSDTEQKGGV